MPVDPRILDLLERWEALRKEGCSATPAELCRDTPELEPELARRIRRLGQFDDLLTPSEGDNTGKGPVNADDADFVLAPGVEGARAIYRRLLRATAGLSGKAYKEALDKALERIAAEASTPGTPLNRLLTKP